MDNMDRFGEMSLKALSFPHSPQVFPQAGKSTFFALAVNINEEKKRDNFVTVFINAF